MASRFSFGNVASLLGIGVTRTKPSPTKEVGGGGYAAYGGVIDSGERNWKLLGDQRWITASEILTNTSIVAAGARYFLNLIAKSNWSVEAAEDQPDAADPSSDAAKEAAEFCESVLYDMESAWTRIVRRSTMFRFHGFGIQEWTAKKRDDGRIGLLDIASRPQHTISAWDLDPESGKVLGVVQTRPQTFERVYLPRQKIVYLVDDTLTDSPEGVGLLRHLVEPHERLKAYLAQEGYGYERDMRGIPVGRAPIAEVHKMIATGSITEDVGNAWLNVMREFVSMQVKQKNTGLLIDSSTYQSQTSDGGAPSAVPKWAVELLTGGVSGFSDINNAVNRLNREMARILGVEHLMLGEGAGTRSLADDKSNNLFMQIEATLGDLAEGYERDIWGPLWILNGLDDSLKPTLKFEAVQFRDVQKITASLRDMATAGGVLSPDDPAINDVRDLMGISRQPDEIVERVMLERDEEKAAADAEREAALAQLNAPSNQGGNRNGA